MPQLNTIVLNDGTADTTYTPSVVNSQGTSVLTDVTAPNYNSRGKVSVSSSQISSAAGGRRVEVRIEEPRVVTDSSTGVVSVLETETISLSFTARPMGTKAERTKLREKLKAALSDATIVAMLDDLENVW